MSINKEKITLFFKSKAFHFDDYDCSTGPGCFALYKKEPNICVVCRELGSNEFSSLEYELCDLYIKKEISNSMVSRVVVLKKDLKILEEANADIEDMDSKEK